MGSDPQPPWTVIWCGEERWRSGNNRDKPIKVEERMDEQGKHSPLKVEQNILAGGLSGARDLLTLAELS